MREYRVTFFDGKNSNALRIVCNTNEIQNYMYSILQGVAKNEKIKPCKYSNETGFYCYSKKNKISAYIITKM